MAQQRKHTLALYYPISGSRLLGVTTITNNINVYLRLMKGIGDIGTGDCITYQRSVNEQAAAAWDGATINIEETVYKVL